MEGVWRENAIDTWSRGKIYGWKFNTASFVITQALQMSFDTQIKKVIENRF